MTLCVNALNGLLLISSEIDELLVNSKSSCQCPQRASTYFFHFHEILWIPFLGVSMPSTGFYLFLQDPFYPKDDIRWCVNALNGLLLISSKPGQICLISEKNRVNALNGLLLISSLYRCLTRERMFGVNALNGLLLISSTDHADFITDCNMCQCPQRASTYFFNKPYNTGGKHNEVSMPSTGFYLFLHMGLHPFLRYRRVSMPSTGFYLFLLSDDQVRANLTAKCQCPQRASTYFFSEQVFDLLSSL